MTPTWTLLSLGIITALWIISRACARAAAERMQQPEIKTAQTTPRNKESGVALIGRLAPIYAPGANVTWGVNDAGNAYSSAVRLLMLGPGNSDMTGLCALHELGHASRNGKWVHHAYLLHPHITILGLTLVLLSLIPTLWPLLIVGWMLIIAGRAVALTEEACAWHFAWRAAKKHQITVPPDGKQLAMYSLGSYLMPGITDMLEMMLSVSWKPNQVEKALRKHLDVYLSHGQIIISPKELQKIMEQIETKELPGKLR